MEFLTQALEFWTLKDPNSRWVLSGAVLLGLTAGLIGCFAFLRNRSLTGDVLAHAALPGVTTAYLLLHDKSALVIFIGALISALLAQGATEFLVRQAKVKEDSALAIVLSTFFALGIFQLTLIQASGDGSQAGLDRILFGQAAALMQSDLQALLAIAVTALLVIFVFYHRLKVFCFDPIYAHALGLRLGAYHLLTATLLVVSIVVGLQLVGVVLMAAMLLIPPSCARYWTRRFEKMIWISGAIGAGAGAAGTTISYVAPRMPTGPWMVVVCAGAFAVSLLCGSERGLLPRLIRLERFRRKTLRENILRSLFKRGEELESFTQCVELGALLRHQNVSLRALETAKNDLQREGLVQPAGRGICLTTAGLERGREITRAHRLWELYLTETVNIPEDHVHHNADLVEHVITKEMEDRLREELNAPQKDPHGKEIP